MDKSKLINRIFKILPIKEDVDSGVATYDELNSYIIKQYVYFMGIDIDIDLKNNIVAMLKGMSNIDALTHKQIRNIVLCITNMIDRGDV